MRVSDWRTASGLDVIAHVLFDTTGVNRDTLRALMEARRWMLAVAAGLAAERRTDAQAEELRALARVAAREQTADFTFFAGLVEAAGNIVFTLILNSVRPIYFEHAALFDGLVTPDQEAMYERAADAVARRDADAAPRRRRRARRPAGARARGGARRVRRGERRAVERLLADRRPPAGDGLPPVERTDAIGAFDALAARGAAAEPRRAARRCCAPSTRSCAGCPTPSGALALRPAAASSAERRSSSPASPRTATTATTR